MSHDRVNPEMADRTTRNIALIGRFLDEVLADDSALADVPNEASLVLVPVDEPDLARANFELALLTANRGEKVRLHLVGRQPVAASAWQANDLSGIDIEEIRPRFPSESPTSADVLVVYDQGRDALLVDFFGGRRQVLGLSVNEYVAIRVDPASHELIGYLVVSFLQVAAARSPVLASALRKAQFRAITASELGGLDIQGSPAGSLSDREALAVVTEISRLIA